MSDLPLPGTQCPCCLRVVPLEARLRTGRTHPETSRAACRTANRKRNERRAEILGILTDRGIGGATDDEVDALTGWGHSSTTSNMNALRRMRLIGWQYGLEGGPVRRKTRADCYARVNVLAQFCVNAAKEVER